MAQRRMFSKEISNASEFQMMSPSAQALYFHIGMNADDDGFCEVFTIVRMTESKPDDLRALHERGFIYLVDSKVGIVKDWHMNNDIRVDRYSRSKYMDDPKYGDIYKVIMEDKIKHLSRYKDCLPSGSTSGITQVRLGKDRIGKDTTTTSVVVKENTFNPLGSEVLKAFELVDPKNKTYYGNKTQRAACDFLILEYGLDKVIKIIEFLPKINQQKLYIKQVTTPYELKENWVKIANAIQQQKSKTINKRGVII